MSKNDIYEMLQAYEGSELDKKELTSENKKLKRKVRRQKALIILLSIKLIVSFLITAVQNDWVNFDKEKLSSDLQEFQEEVSTE